MGIIAWLRGSYHRTEGVTSDIIISQTEASRDTTGPIGGQYYAGLIDQKPAVTQGDQWEGIIQDWPIRSPCPVSRAPDAQLSCPRSRADWAECEDMLILTRTTITTFFWLSFNTFAFLFIFHCDLSTNSFGQRSLLLSNVTNYFIHRHEHSERIKKPDVVSVYCVYNIHSSYYIITTVIFSG